MWNVLAATAASMGGSIIGGLMNKSANEDTNEANAAINQHNIDLQREFAQNGIRWKMADAKAAGVNPLVALGANTTSFSPSSIGMTPDHSMGDMASNMGQDVSRAMSATRTSDERQIAALNIQGAQLDLQGKALDNQIKSTQLNKLNSTGPAFPAGTDHLISGQGNSGTAIVEKPLERTASLPGHPEAEAGAIPDVGWAVTKTGIVPVPSGDIKNRIEDNMFHEGMHFVRNNIGPNFGGGTMPPQDALKNWPGSTHFEWSYKGQEYRPVYPPQDRTNMPDRPGFGGNKNPTQRNIRNYR